MIPGSRVMLGLAALLLLLSVCATADPYAPHYHIYVPNHWINDANGPYRDPVTGRIHLYLQYNPWGALWGNMSWFHYTSEDYVTWRKADPDVAMWPDKWYDADGVFDGTLQYNAEGVPLVIYTCVEDMHGGVQRQCISNPTKSDIDGKRLFDTFVKSPLNPVITQEMVPGIVPYGNFRDPTDWWVDPVNPNRWLISFSTRINNDQGDNAHIVVFSTEDPTFQSGYEFSHTLYMYRYDPDHMFECPDFFNLTKSEYFLKVSTMPSHRDLAVYGSYVLDAAQNQYVYVEDPTRTMTFLDYGPMYASKSFFDPILKQRRMWGWTEEELTDPQILANGWSGVQNILRDVHYDAQEERLKFTPMGEVQGLRISRIAEQNDVKLSDSAPTVIVASSAKATIYQEIVVTFTVPTGVFSSSKYYTSGNEPEVGVMVRMSEDQSKYATVSLKMPVATASPISGVAQNTEFPEFKDYMIADNSAAAQNCSQECSQLRTCESWTLTTGLANSMAKCTIYWKYTAFVTAANSQSGVVNEPLLYFGREESNTIGYTYPLHGRAPLTKATPTQFELRIFVDDSVIETFKDGGLETLTGRIYINNGSAQSGVALYTKNMGDATVTADVTVFTMGSLFAGPQPPNAIRNFTNTLYTLLDTLVDV